MPGSWMGGQVLLLNGAADSVHRSDGTASGQNIGRRPEYDMFSHRKHQVIACHLPIPPQSVLRMFPNLLFICAPSLLSAPYFPVTVQRTRLSDLSPTEVVMLPTHLIPVCCNRRLHQCLVHTTKSVVSQIQRFRVQSSLGGPFEPPA